MARYGFLMNVDRCNGCYACFLACKDEYIGNDHLPTSAATEEGMNLIKVQEFEYGTHDKVKVDYVSIPCQHCAKPICAERFPDAFYKRPDGLVILNPAKAADKEIVGSCPYGCVKWNEKKGIAQKCNGCAHMIDRGEKTTRCSECCPNQALLFGDLDDPKSEISVFIAEHKDAVEELHPEFGTAPVVKYMYLPKPFICGEVVRGDDGQCLKDAKVTATCTDCGTVRTATTDFFGDFEFKYLPKNAPFTVRVEADGYVAVDLKCRTNSAVNFGEIILKKA